MDLAAVVDAVGKDVTRFQPGRRGGRVGAGAYAEYARMPETKLSPKPANLDSAQAAAVPISALTALQAVRDHGIVRAGHRVSVSCSGGGGT